MDAKGKKLMIEDCLSEADLNLISPYVPYLRCRVCKNIMISPKYCQTCKEYFCEQCECIHKNSVAYRHLTELMEKLMIKCKYECTEEKFPLNQIMEHIKTCKYKDYYYLNKGSIYENFLRNKIQSNFEPEKYDNDLLTGLTMEGLLSQDNLQIQIKCFKCKESFDSKKKYFSHILECKSESNHQKMTTDEFESQFNDIIKKLNSFYEKKLDFYNLLFLEEIEKSLSNVNQLFNKYKEKDRQYQELQKSSLALSSNAFSSLPKEVIENNQEIKSLLLEKDKLLKEQNELEKEYKAQSDTLKASLPSIQQDIISRNKEVLEIIKSESTETKWLFDLVSNYSTTKSGKCFKCKDEQNEKFQCFICMNLFCKDNCAKKCKNEMCGSYLCPDCQEECKLCKRKNYCSSCMKKCFYEKCQNLFCQECYDKNKHQVRNENIPCKFFQCDNKLVCLMTTLYCPKCEKRKCSECLQKDKEHFNVLSIFK